MHQITNITTQLKDTMRRFRIGNRSNTNIILIPSVSINLFWHSRELVNGLWRTTNFSSWEDKRTPSNMFVCTLIQDVVRAKCSSNGIYSRRICFKPICVTNNPLTISMYNSYTRIFTYSICFFPSGSKR